ncbi:MAG: hypothetical protein AB7U75_15305 [Hyphomicrobiaceae bacterium]
MVEGEADVSGIQLAGTPNEIQCRTRKALLKLDDSKQSQHMAVGRKVLQDFGICCMGLGQFSFLVQINRLVQ